MLWLVVCTLLHPPQTAAVHSQGRRVGGTGCGRAGAGAGWQRASQRLVRAARRLGTATQTDVQYLCCQTHNNEWTHCTKLTFSRTVQSVMQV